MRAKRLGPIQRAYRGGQGLELPTSFVRFAAPLDLHRRFRLKLDERGETALQAFTRFMERYVNEV